MRCYIYIYIYMYVYKYKYILNQTRQTSCRTSSSQVSLVKRFDMQTKKTMTMIIRKKNLKKKNLLRVCQWLSIILLTIISEQKRSSLLFSFFFFFFSFVLSSKIIKQLPFKMNLLQFLPVIFYFYVNIKTNLHAHMVLIDSRAQVTSDAQ